MDRYGGLSWPLHPVTPRYALNAIALRPNFEDFFEKCILLLLIYTK